MTTSRNPFSVPKAWMIRDCLFSIAIKALVSFVDSGVRQPELFWNSWIRRVLNLIARLYRLDVEEVLRKEAGRRAAWNLIKSVSLYGIETPQRLKAPVSVVWSLSYGCNLHCRHCYQNASKPSHDELTLDEQLGVVDELALAGVSLVVLSGGEPLINPNLSLLIERIRMRGMAVSIDSNGVLMNRHTVEQLKRLGVDSVEISLDSVHKEAHDRFRGLDGAFEKTLNAVELCSSAGIFTTVATTSTALNYADSRELISLARSHGAKRVVFFDLIPAGRGREVEGLHLSQRQLLGLMDLIREVRASEAYEVFTELPQFVVYSSSRNGESVTDDPSRALSMERFTVSSFFDCTGRDNIYRRFANYLGGCPAGRLYCNIQPNGDVTPCMFMPDYPIAGNLRNQPFNEIWNSPTFEALRKRELLKGKCRVCRFVTVCGGCRAKAAAYEGDYLASDPTCPIGAAECGS